MKKMSLLCITFSAVIFCNDQQTNPLNANVVPIFNANVLINTPKTLDEMTSAVSEKEAKLSAAIKKVFQEALLPSKSLEINFSHFLTKRNLFSVFFLTSAITYGVICTNLFVLNKRLVDSSTWANWKKSLTLEELLSVPSGELTLQLVKAIQQHYTDELNPMDVTNPLIEFVVDIKKELAQLKKYMRYIEMLKFVRLAKIFPIDEKKEMMASEQIKRLTYLNTLCNSWTTEYREQKIKRHLRRTRML